MIAKIKGDRSGLKRNKNLDLVLKTANKKNMGKIYRPKEMEFLTSENLLRA